MDAPNTHQVFDWLWTSGQLSAADILQLQSDGFTTVINLTLATSSNALKDEAELVTNARMNYFQIPVVWELPEVEQFYLCADLLTRLHAKGHKIWLHCAMNMRASVFVYLYRKLVLQENEEQSVHPMNEVWTPDAVWSEYIADVIAEYRSD